MLAPVLFFTVVFLVCAVVAARALARMGRQLARTGAELERLGGRMEDRVLPRTERILEETTSTLRDLEATSEQARAVGRSFENALAAVGDMTVLVEHAVRPIVATAASVRVDNRRARAIRAGFAAAWRRLLHRAGRESTVRPALEAGDSPVPPDDEQSETPEA